MFFFNLAVNMVLETFAYIVKSDLFLDNSFG